MNRPGIAFVVLMTGSAWVHANSYDPMLRRYERQIQQQERLLKDLRGDLSQKERDSARWQSKAEESQTLWSRAAAAVKETTHKVEKTHEQVTAVRKQVQEAQISVMELSLRGQTTLDHLRWMTAELYRQQTAPRFFSADLFATTASRAITGTLIQTVETTQQTTTLAREKELNLRDVAMRRQREEQRLNQDLDGLRQDQEANWSKWQAARRRVTALRDEMSQMEQSAEALKIMLKDLRQQRSQTLAAKRGDLQAPPLQLSIARGSLPWPVRGRVSQSFGRQHSKELNQLLISNGIKIDATAGGTVRVVDEGKVLYSSEFRSYGKLVIVQHKGGLASVYAGLAETSVKEGQEVHTLDSLGTLGNSGSFYFELRHHEEPINPIVWLAPNQQSEVTLRRK